jgi:hypothetical protein
VVLNGDDRVLAAETLAPPKRENETKLYLIFTCQDVTISPVTLISGSYAWSNAPTPRMGSKSRRKLDKYAHSYICDPSLSGGFGQSNRLNRSAIAGSMQCENGRSQAPFSWGCVYLAQVLR